MYFPRFHQFQISVAMFDWLQAWLKGKVQSRLPVLCSNKEEMDHSRFLVNQTRNSRSKTTTIPRFATMRHTRLDYAIVSRFCNRGSIPIEPRFFTRGLFLRKKDRKKERKRGRKEGKKGRMEGRKKEREKEYCKLKN